MRKLVAISLFLLIHFQILAKITLPAVFTDNMVLQRNSQVAIWGWANPSEKIKIVGSWNSKDTIVAITKNTSQWMAKLPTTEAGGPYTLTLIAGNTITLQNVMLGEVWICSGQSNMEWSVNAGIINGEQEAAQANHPNIRFFHIPRVGADFPQDDCKASWTVCTPETMRTTSAVGYFFGRELQQNLNVPIGLIVSAWGGTPAEVWVPKDLIENNSALKNAAYDDGAAWWPSAPGTTYNAMIAPVVPYGIAGAIWYQGESNRYRPHTYGQLMTTLIESWRKDFEKPFPFYYVQIAPYTYDNKGKAYIVREQQAKTMKEVPNTGMVVVSDLVDNIKDIHPKNKLDVGKRLAAWALAETYGKKQGIYKSPMYQSMKAEKGKIRVSVENADNGLQVKGKTITGFQIAGEDQKFVDATAQLKGKEIIVSSKAVKNPVAVRFCFDETSMPIVFNKEGLPLAPFRTDTWEVE
jgi:sialate O-acetylesterase